MGPVDYNELREVEVLVEEEQLAARFGRTSRGGTATCARPMARDHRDGGNRKRGTGERLSIRTKLGRLQRTWERWEPRRVVRPDTGPTWRREVAWLRDQLGLEEDNVNQKTKTRVSKDDIYRAVVLASPNGLTGSWVRDNMGVDGSLAVAVLRELQREGKVKARQGTSGPKGGRAPVVFYVEPKERDAVIATGYQPKGEPEADHPMDDEDDLDEVINRVREILVAYTKRRVGVALAQHKKDIIDAFDRALSAGGERTP